MGFKNSIKKTTMLTLFVMSFFVSTITVNAAEKPEENIDDLEYDYLVDGSIAYDIPEENIYKTVQAAYEAASEGTEQDPTVIAIKPDVYMMNGDSTKVGLEITKNYLSFIGLSDDPDDVVLADNRGQNYGASGNRNSTTVFSNSIGLTMKNLTIINYCNLDYEYKLDPSKSL